MPGTCTKCGREIGEGYRCDRFPKCQPVDAIDAQRASQAEATRQYAESVLALVDPDHVRALLLARPGMWTTREAEWAKALNVTR